MEDKNENLLLTQGERPVFAAQYPGLEISSSHGRIIYIPKLKHDYVRRYSLTSYILMFFVFSFIGWAWEVGIHIFEDGRFVNRGVMIGPWLPIYGCGGTAAIFLFKRFAKNPILTFFTVLFFCTLVEYFTSVYLEKTTGHIYWDYTGYFLNINGRVCLLGAVIFGTGGCAAIYLLGPFLDDFFKRVSIKAKNCTCIVLIILFAADVIHANFYPNTGAGITDYAVRITLPVF